MKKVLSVAIVATTLYSCGASKIARNDYKVNDSVSRAEWKGAAKDHSHIGSFKVTGGLSTTTEGVVNGGDFTIPIASIEDYDLQDPLKKALLDDLLSENFFNAILHPNANFHINTVVPYSSKDTTSVPGANYLVTGDFSMLGKAHTISFPARITKTPEGLSTLANLKIDRTRWGMTKYSDPSQPLYILPDVNIHLDVKAAMLK